MEKTNIKSLPFTDTNIEITKLSKGIMTFKCKEGVFKTIIPNRHGFKGLYVGQKIQVTKELYNGKGANSEILYGKLTNLTYKKIGEKAVLKTKIIFLEKELEDLKKAYGELGV